MASEDSRRSRATGYAFVMLMAAITIVFAVIAQLTLGSAEITIAVFLVFGLPTAFFLLHLLEDARRTGARKSLPERAQQPVNHRVEPRIRPASDIPRPPTPSR